MANGYYNGPTAGSASVAASAKDYWSKQAVMKYADAATRTADAALTAVLREGMVSTLDDVNTLQVYSGSTWSTIGPVHGAWTTYTPTWAASGTAVSAGNAAIGGHYMRVGRFVTAQVTWTWGSTSTFGTGNYSFTLPVAASAFGGSGSGIHIRSGAASFYGLIAYATAGATAFTMMLGGTTTNQFYGQAIPNAQANGDGGYVTITYEAAADA